MLFVLHYFKHSKSMLILIFTFTDRVLVSLMIISLIIIFLILYNAGYRSYDFIHKIPALKVQLTNGQNYLGCQN